jgi:hypothetical protein
MLYLLKSTFGGRVVLPDPVLLDGEAGRRDLPELIVCGLAGGGHMA